MDPLTTLISPALLIGAGVILLAVKTCNQILALPNQNQYTHSWQVLRLLMILFVLGYLAVFCLMVGGLRDWIIVLTGIVLLLGTVFVCLVVRVGYLMVRDLSGQATTLNMSLQDAQRSKREYEESESLAKPILDSVRMGILIIDSESNQILDANPAAVSMIGVSKDKIVGSVCHQFVCPAHRGKCPILNLGQRVDNAERVLLTANGDKLPIVKTVVASVVGGRKCLIESFFDITPQKQAEHALQAANEQLALELDERGRMEKALRESEERYALAVRGANDGLWDWNLQTNQVYYSPRWKSMLGCSENQVSNNPNEWLNRVNCEDLPRLQAELTSHLNGQSAQFECEYRIQNCDGSFRWMLCRGLAARNDKGEALRIAGSQTDITRQKMAEEKLAHDALHDPLTGLPNRILFMDRLSHVVKRTKRAGGNQSAVLFLDIDRFKWINDSLGHSVGDQLLAAIGRRLESCIRPGDTIARFGGDEFTILIEGISSPTDTTEIADRVQGKLQSPFLLGGHEISITASIGIAEYAGESSSPLPKRPEEILRDADTAMYRAKSLGRARKEVFDKSMHVHAVARLHMEEGLRRGLERQEFRVHYQPIFSLSTGAVTAVEALLRWQHPELGLIPPGEFLSIAEETGLIVPIGEWVLRTACAQARSWHATGYPHLEVAVNCSARQFREPNLASLVGRIVRETGILASKLQIELTESTAMNDHICEGTLAELHEMGVQISLDDFGDGYSALSNLKHLPLSILKIDRSLLKGIAVDSGDAAILTAIISLAQSLNLRAIAEGVETQEEREFLSSRQCGEVQGFLFSRPLEAEKITGLLHECCTANCALVPS